MQFEAGSGKLRVQKRAGYQESSEMENGEWRKRTERALNQTCVPPLVSLQLVRPGEPPATVRKVTLVWLLTWHTEQDP